MFSVKFTYIALCTFVLPLLVKANTAKIAKMYNQQIVSKECLNLILHKQNISTNITFTEKCCSGFANTFRSRSHVNLQHMSQYLDHLKLANCSEFYEECAARRYQFTPSSELMYDYFCNASAVASKCFPELNQSESNNLILFIENRQQTGHNMTTCDCDEPMLLPIIEEKRRTNYHEPCAQVAMVMAANISSMHEIVSHMIPFCDIVFCMFDTETLENNNISIWTCLPNR